MPNATRLLIYAALLALVAGCEEKPDQQLVQSETRAQDRDQEGTTDARRQRTLGQGESDRIYNQGGLR